MNTCTPIPWHTDHVREALATAETPGVHPHVFQGISTDSRTITGEDLFVALRGDTFDGHRFVMPLLERGIKGFVVKKSFFHGLSPSEKAAFSHRNSCLFCVDNPLDALGRLAAFQRRRSHAKVIAITGSCGKTSTREMTTSIFTQKYKVLSTQGNLNNEIGVPLTLLKLSSAHQWAVVELGMNHEGELSRLGHMAGPDMGIITNTFKAHLEGLGSVEAVARAKSELLPCILDGGIAILNRDDERCHIMEKVAKRLPIRRLFFGTAGDTDVTADTILPAGDTTTFTLTTSNGATEITLSTPAPVMVQNALAAATAALEAGFKLADIRRGLAAFQPVKGRMEILTPGRGVKLINDTYNANPGSMAAALDMLKQQPGHPPTMAVLGDMLELGEMAPELHREVGKKVSKTGISHLFIHGDMAEYIMEGAVSGGFSMEKILIGNHETLIAEIRKNIIPGMWILVKGSRGMHMEHIVTALQQSLGEED